ncbi:hypothetical protein BDK51DRAFT_50003 [Blyttiomyces helicus]|uniref:Secreted protein n=1 Tax=Blyttiomyces helicus TaxID=388810 RepID=A0A4P9W057_9FUNG|nr:hypothetical protein BDK51DRAFT_50003 [Blyttiomyces helicus]|eukprot:RKO83396.1 hypothetical protein BDK51DRAFT_50003 [Blyttiomyces helicus]
MLAPLLSLAAAIPLLPRAAAAAVTASTAPAVVNASAFLQIPPPMPKAWPNIDQTVLISGALLTDPLVAEPRCPPRPWSSSPLPTLA